MGGGLRGNGFEEGERTRAMKSKKRFCSVRFIGWEDRKKRMRT